MKKKNKLKIAAAVSAALLLGGAVLLFKDDFAQEINTEKLKDFAPPIALQNQLDDYTDSLIAETTSVPNTESITSETIVTDIADVPVQASDTLPAEVRQELMETTQSLKTAYPDALGWLYIPNTAISYPVMQSDDNAYYLSHAYDGSYLKAGSVFLDYRCESRFMNPINILYAHNMKNGSMFAGVLSFTNDSYFESHRYGWLATPETVYRIDFFSCSRADWHDELYNGSSPISEWIPRIYDKSVVSREMTYSDEDRFISLSTCSYEFRNARTILTGKLTETKEA